MFDYARNYREYIHVATEYSVLTSAPMAETEQETEPVLLVAVAKKFLADFALVRGYASLDDFLRSYKPEDVHTLPEAAEKARALMYSYCEQTQAIYVPKEHPEGSIEALCLLQGEMMERKQPGGFAPSRL